ncbi:AraC family transcriptional regulator ligand-binding domain-containing protein [Pseudomonas lini]
MGIDPALLDQPTARVPATAFAALWLVQIRELNDEFFSSWTPMVCRRAVFALICRALIQEPTLEKGHASVPGQFRPVPA